MDTVIFAFGTFVVGLLGGLWLQERARRRDWERYRGYVGRRPKATEPEPESPQPPGMNQQNSLAPFSTADRDRIIIRNMELGGVSRAEAEKDADNMIRQAQALGLGG